jgi:hypothetical protein
VFTVREQRKHRERLLRSLRLAKGLCSIISWAWRSLLEIERLIQAYRGRIQEIKKAAGGSGLRWKASQE